MRIFITGGTGLIGSAIVKNLIAHDHQVFALARSDISKNKLITAGATPIPGDITRPEKWCADLPDIDAAIHTACDFSDAMPQMDATLLDHLIPALTRPKQHHSGPVRFIYTGGNWMYPQTNATPTSSGVMTAVDETTPFDPLPEFIWGLTGIKRVLSAANLAGIVIHPSCVYDTGEKGQSGILARDIETAQTDNRVTLVGGDDIYQPMVHADDIADLYRLALEHAKPGESYIGSAINDVSTREVAELIATHFGAENCQIDTISTAEAMARYGNWARGLAHNQQLSSAKAMQDLGWSPRHTDFAADMARHAKTIAKLGPNSRC